MSGMIWGSRIFGETSVKIIPGSLNALGHAMLRNTAAINPLTLAQTLTSELTALWIPQFAIIPQSKTMNNDGPFKYSPEWINERSTKTRELWLSTLYDAIGKVIGTAFIIEQLLNRHFLSNEILVLTCQIIASSSFTATDNAEDLHQLGNAHFKQMVEYRIMEDMAGLLDNFRDILGPHLDKHTFNNMFAADIKSLIGAIGAVMILCSPQTIGSIGISHSDVRIYEKDNRYSIPVEAAHLMASIMNCTCIVSDFWNVQEAIAAPLYDDKEAADKEWRIRKSIHDAQNQIASQIDTTNSSTKSGYAYAKIPSHIVNKKFADTGRRVHGSDFENNASVLNHAMDQSYAKNRNAAIGHMNDGRIIHVDEQRNADKSKQHKLELIDSNTREYSKSTPPDRGDSHNASDRLAITGPNNQLPYRKGSRDSQHNQYIIAQPATSTGRRIQ